MIDDLTQALNRALATWGECDVTHLIREALRQAKWKLDETQFKYEQPETD